MNIQLKIVMSLTLIFAAMAHAQKLEYRKILADDTTAITVTIQPHHDGFTCRIESTSGSGRVLEEGIIGGDGLARQWSYSNAAEQLKVDGRLQNGVINLEAKNKGKELTRTLKPAMAWRQLFPYDLASFVMSPVDTIEFESIGLFGPGAFKLGKMVGVKLGDETIRVGNADCICVRIRVGLAGILARFWHADYYFRKSDGRFMQGSWVEKGGAQPSKVLLVKEWQ